MAAPPDQIIATNRAARQRAEAFPGGGVRPSQIPFGGAPGPKMAGEQVVVRAGLRGLNASESPAGAPGSVVGPPAMRPGQYGGGGSSPRQRSVPRNGQRAGEIVNGNGNGNGHPMGQRPLLWLAVGIIAVLLLRRK